VTASQGGLTLPPRIGRVATTPHQPTPKLLPGLLRDGIFLHKHTNGTNGSPKGQPPGPWIRCSQHPIITETRNINEHLPPTIDAKTLTDIRVKTLGTLDAQINNLENAAIKTQTNNATAESQSSYLGQRCKALALI
jgi:hypothetical protein